MGNFYGGGGVINFLGVEVEKIWMSLEFFGEVETNYTLKRTQHFKKLFRDKYPYTLPHYYYTVRST